MEAQRTDGSMTLESLDPKLQLQGELPGGLFDWVDLKCSCPHCGRRLDSFRTRDLCNTLDTVDYRIAHHFYAECECGAWIDFIRKPARSLEDFDMRVEQP
jgi:hypothetical protein